MNDEILKLTQQFGFTKTITDISVTLEKTSSSTVVFYTLNSGPENEKKFLERLDKSNCCLVFVSAPFSRKIKDKEVIELKGLEFIELQEKFLNILCPLPDIKLVAVTGTNGKTSTVTLSRQIAGEANVEAASLGTLGLYIGEKQIQDLGMTTPSFIDFRKIVHSLSGKVKVLFFELSSHALIQNRIYNIKLDAAGWTSFSQDHLDYHKTMEEYFIAKQKVNDYLRSGKKIILPSEEVELINKIKETKTPFFVAKSLEDLKLKQIPEELNTVFGRRNLELSLNLCKDIGIDIDKIDLNKLKAPRGRFSVILNKNSKVIIDYAHTPDALEKVIEAAKKTFPNFKILTIFGCGGNRDNKKRPIMGEIASRLSDDVIITSDNPRNEDPLFIIEEIKQGIKDKKNFNIEPDRAKAILAALKKQDDKSVIIIAGKGHEDYQEIKGVKYPFSDFAIVEEFVGNKK